MTLLPITLVSLNIALFCMAPILGNKIINLWGFTILGGTVATTLSNGLVDVINNAYGLKTARSTVLAGAMVRAIVWLVFLLVLALPAQSQTPGFEKVATFSIRLLLAGEVSHIVSQYFIDTTVFDWVKRHLRQSFWLRYNVSNAVSYAIGNATFTLLAFLGTGKPILSIILGTILWRFLASFALTPVFALLSRWATKAATAAALVLALFAGHAYAAQEIGPLELSSSTRVMMSTGNYPAHIEEVALVTWKDQSLWTLDLFNWDRAGITTAGTKEIPQNAFNNRLIVAWTPLWCLGPEAEWQVVTGNTPVWRAGLACKFSEAFWGFKMLSSTTANFSTGQYDYAVGEFFYIKHEIGLFAQDILMWWFGGGAYRLNNKLTFGYEVVPHFAVIGQIQTATSAPIVWRWGIQGSL